MPSGLSTAEAYWENLHQVALEIGGGHHSSWNEDVSFEFRRFTAEQVRLAHRRPVTPPRKEDPGNGEPERRRSAVQRTGTILWDHPRVVMPVNQLYAAAPLHRTAQIAGVTGLRATLQPHLQLQAPEGREFGELDSSYWDGGLDDVDRFFGEAAARGLTPRLRGYLPKPIARQLEGVQPEYDDPVGTAAAENLAGHLGSDSTTVLRLLMQQTPAGRMRLAAEMALAKSPVLTPRMPDTIRTGVTDRVADLLTEGMLEAAAHDHEADLREAEGQHVPVSQRVRSGELIGTETFAKARGFIDVVEARLMAYGPVQLEADLRADQPGRSAGLGQGFPTDSPTVAALRAPAVRNAARAGHLPPRGRLRD